MTPRFSQFLFYLPAAVCLYWLLLHSLLASRMQNFVYMALQLGNLVLYHLFPVEPLIYLTVPMILPLSWMYLESLRTGRTLRTFETLWMIVPVSLFTAGLLIDILGSVHAHELDQEKVILGWVYRSVIGLEGLLFIIYLVALVYRFHVKPLKSLRRLFRGGTVSTLEMQLCVCFFAIPITSLSYFVTEAPWTSLVSILMAVNLYSFGLVGLLGDTRSVTLEQGRRMLRFNYSPSTRDAVIESQMMDLSEELPAESLPRIQEHISENLHRKTQHRQQYAAPSSLASALFSAAPEGGSREDDSLVARFQILMTEEKMYLQPGLSLEDVAKRLHSNKTYISKLVNHTYNIGFPELMNILRVDYAEQYIIAHPDARQQEIARACGFLSASSFNNTFKKITGYTPKLWLAGLRTT